MKAGLYFQLCCSIIILQFRSFVNRGRSTTKAKETVRPPYAESLRCRDGKANPCKDNANAEQTYEKQKKREVTEMVYTAEYFSLFGRILLAADKIGMRGLWFDGQKYFAHNLPDECREKETPVLSEAMRWLDIYFAGKEPDFLPPLHPIGSPFRQEVWKILLQIPYGKTVTYGDISKQLAKKMGLAKMSAQAVGGAVGHNEISIIIPCHRVVGTNGSLTGYAGGIDRKIKLLALEHADADRLFIPKKGTAL